MGWIAALKQGSPSVGDTETLVVKDETKVNPDVPITFVDGTGLSGEGGVSFGAPGSHIQDGYVKTIIRIDEVAQNIVCLPDSDVRGDESDSDAVTFLSGKKGGVGRWVWANKTWYLIPGGDAEADLDITVS
tara:strand:- start:312 stop:704 length:393 start_codon:yes stop_codon:yes gene_type:complete